MANARLEYFAGACCLEMRWAAWLICQTTIEQLQTQSHLLRVWTQTQLQLGTESSGTNKKASKIRRRKNHRENKHRAAIVPVSTSPDASHSYDKKPCQAPTRTLKLSAELMPKERSFKWQACEKNPRRISAGKSESQSCWNDRYASSTLGCILAFLHARSCQSSNKTSN